MTAQMTPSWYDLLGMDPEAAEDEIRAAWRTAIAELDPTDRRFALLSEAARVLLDPAQRAAYDAELAVLAAEAGLSEPQTDAGPDTDAPGEEDGEETGPVATAEAAPSGAPRIRKLGFPALAAVRGWMLVALAVLTASVAGLAAYVGLRMPSDQSVEDATLAAQAAADRAVVPILSYDGRHLAASKAAAVRYLTPSYREQYDQVFDGIIKRNAPATGTVVKATLLNSGIVRSGDDRVQVFAFVDQSRTNAKDKTPEVFKNWVTLTMEKVGGTWLVADMQT